MEGTKTSHHYIQWASSIRSKDDIYGSPNPNQALGLIRTGRLNWQLSCAISTPEIYRSVACAFGFPKFLEDPALSIKEVNQRQKLGSFDLTFLFIAVQNGYYQTVQLLLGQGADINAKLGIFRNALCTAIYEHDDKMVQILLDEGADINTENGYREALLAASRSENDKMKQMLLEKEVDFKVRNQIDGEALQWASREGHEKVVQILLDKGADIDAQDYDDALYQASERGHEKVVQMLLDKGVNVNAQGGRFVLRIRH